MQKSLYGVVDIGTLKVKCEIASLDTDGTLVREYASNNLTCFGVGVDENNGYAHEKRIVDTVTEFKRVAQEFRERGVEHSRVVSTHAMRKIKNREEVLSCIDTETGFKVEVISQDEEAQLFFSAVMRTFTNAIQPYVVLDIGGGSVQVLVGTKGKLIDSRLLHTGTVTLHERYVKDPHNPESFTLEEDLEKMRADIVSELNQIQVVYGAPLVYGSSMVISVMKAIGMRLDSHEYSKIHPYKTYTERLDEFMRYILKFSHGERDGLYNLPHGYMWGIDKGFLNALTVGNYFKSPYIIPSNANIAQGIIYSLISK